MEQEAKKEDSEFYGVQIESERILFIMDKSGSMSSPVSYADGTRIENLKIEFKKMLDDLDSKKRLGVLWFAGNETYPRKGVSLNTTTFQKGLKKHIDEVNAGGGTPINEAIHYAFEHILIKYKVDTIYLLSDGAPTDAKPDKICEAIRAMNLDAFIKIHTISIGQESGFLKQVARENYGTYNEVK